MPVLFDAERAMRRRQILREKAVNSLIYCHHDAIEGLLRTELQNLGSDGVARIIIERERRIEKARGIEVNELQRKLSLSRQYRRSWKGLFRLFIDLLIRKP